MIHLFLEDSKGQPTFETLVGRITNKKFKYIRLKGGEILNAKSVIAHIKVSRPMRDDSVLALADKDCQKERYRQVKEIERQVSEVFPDLSFQYIIAVEETESWLSADTNALETLLKPSRPLQKSPQGECHDPKEYLKNIYRAHAKRPYVPTIENPRIANQIDLRIVRSLNRSFDDFCKAIS
ncbi:MAG: DUF4276 family protein [SAR202 cluster bacterium]|nr:DUF4276 family protein [SAR202 cluster bacterium]